LRLDIFDERSEGRGLVEHCQAQRMPASREAGHRYAYAY
jgi:hypothetical protein